MKPNTLIVSETFYSIQGEGRTMGAPSVFLRLGGCNLLCEGEGWRCDTIEVWKKGKAVEFENILKEEYITYLKNDAHLVITGGEPMLQSASLVDYFFWFYATFQFKPFIEIETNGTILPKQNALIMEFVSQWNCSPKLSTSGAGSYDKRVNEVALRWLSSMRRSQFKFVISCEQDIDEMVNDFIEYIPVRRIVLMPAGDSREKLDLIRPHVVEACKRFGFYYSERLHIVIWDKKTGV